MAAFPFAPHAMSRLLCFTDAELDGFARAADAMTARMGKPVLAEIIAEDDIGAECVIFALPLQPGEADDDIVKVNLGGAQARFVGNCGGLAMDDEALECALLWAVQLSDLHGVRFIRLDAAGEEVAWGAELADILPFALDAS